MIYAEDIKQPSDLLKLGMKDFTKDLIIKLFANFSKEDNSSRFKFNDKITIPKGVYYGYPHEIKTTLGRYILNKAIIPEPIFKVVGKFYNEEWTGGYIEKTIISDLQDALYDSKINPDDFIVFIDNLQFFGFSMISVVMTSMTEKTTFVLDEVRKEKKKLLKDHAEEIKNGDPFITSKIEKKLIDTARKTIGDDPGMALYDSGAKASFGNNYKNMFIMKGAIRDNKTGKYNISTTNYSDGIDKEETHFYADDLTSGSYSKGKGTQIGGYIVKKYNAALQSITLDKKDTFCGCVKTRRLKLTKDNVSMFKDRYIKVGNRKVVLTKEVAKNYIDKYVDMYDPIYCTGDKLCNVCAGDLYYKIGLSNIGLTVFKVGSILLNKKLKNFHDSTVKVKEITNADLSKIILE